MRTIFSRRIFSLHTVVVHYSLLLYYFHFVHSHFSSTLTSYDKPIEKFLQPIPFYPPTFYIPLYFGQEVSGIWAKVNNNSDNIYPYLTIQIFNETRFSIVGNNSKELRVHAIGKLSVHEISDVLNVVKNTSLVWSNNNDGEEDVVDLTRFPVTVEWAVEIEFFVWCSKTRLFYARSSEFTYEEFIKSTGRGYYTSTIYRVVTGMVIDNPIITEFVIGMKWEGMVCGKYNKETLRWEWGCYPLAGMPIQSFRWEPNEPSFPRNESIESCICVTQPLGLWRVCDCGVSTSTLWTKHYKASAGPVSGYVTFSKPMEEPVVKIPPSRLQTELRVSYPRQSNTTGALPLHIQNTSATTKTVLYSTNKPKDAMLILDESKRTVEVQWSSSSDKVGSELNVTVYWGVVENDACPRESAGNVIDPLRGVCWMSCPLGTASMATLSRITNRYDASLFINNSNYD
eukprot:PhF_6_TR27554/c1_g1_i2/m.40415